MAPIEDRMWRTILGALLFSNLIAAQAPDAGGGAGENADARRVWELAVSAKGGRERLWSVRTMAQHLTASYDIGPLRLRAGIYEHFYVLPNRYWEWVTEPRVTPYTSVQVIMVDKDTRWFRWENEPGVRVSEIPALPVWELLHDQLFALLETRWLKPELLGVKRGRLGWGAVDIVAARISGGRFDIYIDRKSRLPRRIVEHRMVTRQLTILSPPEPPKPYEIVWDLEDYRPVSGILLPHTLKQRGRDGITERVTYEINPEYDPRVFEDPPSADFGPRDWMKVP